MSVSALRHAGKATSRPGFRVVTTGGIDASRLARTAVGRRTSTCSTPPACATPASSAVTTSAAAAAVLRMPATRPVRPLMMVPPHRQVGGRTPGAPPWANGCSVVVGVVAGLLVAGHGLAGLAIGGGVLHAGVLHAGVLRVAVPRVGVGCLAVRRARVPGVLAAGLLVAGSVLVAGAWVAGRLVLVVPGPLGGGLRSGARPGSGAVIDVERVDRDRPDAVGVPALTVGLDVGPDLEVPARARERQFRLLLAVVEDVDLAVGGDDPHVEGGAELVVGVDDLLGLAVVV